MNTDKGQSQLIKRTASSRSTVPEIRVDSAEAVTSKNVKFQEAQDENRLTRPKLADPDFSQYYVNISSGDGLKSFVGKDGVIRITPTPSVTTMDIFLSAFRKNNSHLQILADPNQRPQLLEKNIDSAQILICFLLVLVSVIVGLANYVYTYLAPTFVKSYLLSVFTPSRIFASVWEFIIVSTTLAWYAFFIMIYPELKSYRFWPRFSWWWRWTPYFCLVFDLILIFGFWCLDISRVESIEETMLSSMKNISYSDIWNSTQSYFECCGTGKPKDWETMKTFIPKTKGGNKFTYPTACCNFYNGPCDFRPLENEIWERGCLTGQLATAYSVLGINLALCVISIVISFRMFFFLIAVEKLANESDDD